MSKAAGFAITERRAPFDYAQGKLWRALPHTNGERSKTWASVCSDPHPFSQRVIC
jgi:hypothetical protein